MLRLTKFHLLSCSELLVGEADVNARDNELKTPLHYAVLGGYEAILQSLCNHGASVNAADTNGQTALHKAALQGQLGFVQELIARGADVNARLQACPPPHPPLLPRRINSA